MTDRIVITQDDLEHAVRANAQLESAGFATTLTASLEEARAALKRYEPEAIILTGGLHEGAAAQLLALARDRAVSTLGLVEPTEPDPKALARTLGLTAWLRKPADAGEVVATVRRLIERRRLQQRTGIIGESPAIQEVLVKIEQMAPVTSTVLIEGESGTGKELVARGIHDLSPRRGQAFIAVNCAALPETLLESELFGHEKGSFTGAAERRLGRFELADGGTIFLDEVGEMPTPTQVKLLRVLADRSFFRVGGPQPITADVRVMAATREIAGQELEFIFRSLVELKLQMEELRRRLEERPQHVEVIEVGPGAGAGLPTVDAEPVPDGHVVYRAGMTMADVERAAIEGALKETRGNRRRAAEVLGIGERTLYRKLKEYALA